MHEPCRMAKTNKVSSEEEGPPIERGYRKVKIKYLPGSITVMSVRIIARHDKEWPVEELITMRKRERKHGKLSLCLNLKCRQKNDNSYRTAQIPEGRQ